MQPRNPKQARVKLARVQCGRGWLSPIDEKVDELLPQISQCRPGAIQDHCGLVSSATITPGSEQADDPVLPLARFIIF
jgi:hypothetical protein